MIDNTKIKKAEELKKAMDAAYTILKKRPSTENATKWTMATRSFNDYCVKIITEAIAEDNEDKRQEILQHFDEYKVCKSCGKELLFLADKNNYVAHGDFVEDFKGWCYDCLVKYCTERECVGCTVTPNPFNCPFLELKKLNE